MNDQDNKSEQNETALTIQTLNHRELEAIRLRYLGKSSTEIGTACGYDPAYVRRLFMEGGRLQAAYEEFAEQQKRELQKATRAVMDVARREAENAIGRLVELSKNADNEAVVFRASQYLLAIIGVSENDRPATDASPEASLRELLKAMGYERAHKAVIGLFDELFQKNLRSFSINFNVLPEAKQGAINGE